MAGPIIRSSNLQFLLDRAEEARGQAEAATLDHVRERCRRSEAAWEALADKARRSERLRLEEAERKAAIAATSTNDVHQEFDGLEKPAVAMADSGPIHSD
jgi:hypothetical protein